MDSKTMIERLTWLTLAGPHEMPPDWLAPNAWGQALAELAAAALETITAQEEALERHHERSGQMEAVLRERILEGGGRTQEQLDADALAGEAHAAMVLMSFDGMPLAVAYNAVGSLAANIFAATEFEQPQYALEEFDNWANHTREYLAAIIKARMQ